MRTKRKVRNVWWREVLRHCCGRGTAGFTAAEISHETELQYTGVTQVLGRLQTWGLLNHVSFAPALDEEGERSAGRRRKVYEVTPRGHQRSAYQGGKRRGR